MVSLSEKLAEIELDVFAYDKYLESINEKVTVINENLRCYNFKHVGEHLCELWKYDNINSYPIITIYIKEYNQSDFLNINEES